MKMCSNVMAFDTIYMGQLHNVNVKITLESQMIGLPFSCLLYNNVADNVQRHAAVTPTQGQGHEIMTTETMYYLQKKQIINFSFSSIKCTLC